MSERYGYVNYHTPDLPEDDRIAGRWRFLLADSVSSFTEAWDAAEDDFSKDRDAFTYAHQEGRDLNLGDLVGEFPDILARHGLTLVEDPPGDEVTAEHDVFLVSLDDRCDFEEDDGKLCGAILDDGEGWDGKCGDHADRIYAAENHDN